MDFSNPYSDEAYRKASPGEQAVLLASYAKNLSFLIGVKFTQDEEAALAKVIGGILREQSWIKDIPMMKAILAKPLV